MLSDRSLRALGACAVLCASVSMPALAQAQLAGEVAPPERAQVDENGVNVATGQYRSVRTNMVVGSGIGALADTRIYGRPADRDLRVQLPDPFSPSPGPSGFVVGTEDKTYNFTSNGNAFASASDGARLVSVPGSGYQLILTDGTKYNYTHREDKEAYSVGFPFDYGIYYYLTSIEYSNGLKKTFGWATKSYCVYGAQRNVEFDDPKPICATAPQNPWATPTTTRGPRKWITRLDWIANTAGNRIDYQYAGTWPSPLVAPTQGQIAGWSTATGALGSNAQGGAGPLPSVTYAYSSSPSGSYYYWATDQVTDALGRTTWYSKLTGTTAPYEAMRRPGSAADDLRVNMDVNYRVTSVVRHGATWTYAFSTPTATTSALTVTGPTGRVRRYASDLNVGLPTRVEDEYGRATLYAYTSGRLTSATSPAGQVASYGYDAKGNVTSTTVTAAGGGATLTSSATYADLSCATAGTCNRMVSSTDARGVVTTYAYDPTHGGMISAVTQNASGASPSVQTRYTQVAGVWLPNRTWTCRTSANCENGGDAVQTITTYNANLLPTSVTSGAGDGSLTATTSVTYSAAGDLLTVDGPLQDVDDTTRYYHDAARQALGGVGPDPDGGGPLPRQAVRADYDAAGRVTSVSQGTASGRDDAALANMTVLQTQTTTLDAAGRATSVALSAGGAVFSRVDHRYDAAGYRLCTAQRMNPAALGAPQDACVVGGDAGYGPDRVTQTQYSAPGAGNPASISVTSAAGTAEASTETVVETATGKPARVTDGNGNVTTYGYDGFDRASTTTYPNGSYEQASYAANGDLTSRRLRDGQVIGYGYDALGRLASKDVPNGVHWATDKSYGYDLLGRLTSASDSNGRSLGFGYDALGRRTSQSDNWYGPGNASYQYDAAGRRTRLTWWDGVFVSYAYDAAGNMTVIRENGGFALATFGYDGLGRRTSLARGNGTTTAYAYDAASRLTGLTLNGGNQPQAITLSYTPAGQIASRSGSNDAYSFTGLYNVDRPYGVNELNQLTSAGTVPLGYDGRGNLTSSGSDVYGYTSENALATAPGANLAYDPLDRLFNLPDAGVNTTLVYDGADVTAEVNQATGALLRRYVFGPGSDEPLVWYEGGQRRYLHADERGSVVAVSDDAGTAIAINRYDEYGIPQAGNLGRFQYTGQKWLPSVGLYDYKARMYSPTLGRFLQTDPIGYGDGLNWYNYVGGDPVNNTDPSGLADDDGDVVVNGCRRGQVWRYDWNLGYGRCVVWNPNDTPRIFHIPGAGYIPSYFGGRGYSGGFDFAAPGGGGAVGAEPAAMLQSDHRYVLRRNSECSANDVFDSFKEYGMSAPGAPRAREGFTPRIVLTGNNPISQNVDSSARNITNVTLRGHTFYPGTVSITVRQNGSGSSIEIIGTGSGNNPLLNDITGKVLFGNAARRAAQVCLVDGG